MEIYRIGVVGPVVPAACPPTEKVYPTGVGRGFELVVAFNAVGINGAVVGCCICKLFYILVNTSHKVPLVLGETPSAGGSACGSGVCGGGCAAACGAPLQVAGGEQHFFGGRYGIVYVVFFYFVDGDGGVVDVCAGEGGRVGGFLKEISVGVVDSHCEVLACHRRQNGIYNGWLCGDIHIVVLAVADIDGNLV